MPFLGSRKLSIDHYKDDKFMKPSTNDQHDNEYWQIRFTEEIFSDYEEYYNRILLYRQRIWTCAVTGVDRLTFEEALASEQRGRTTSSKLPLCLQKKILELTQFSTVTRMDQLCDHILSYLKHNYAIGEEVICTGSDGVQSTVKVLESIGSKSINDMDVAEKYLVEDVVDSEKVFHVGPDQLGRKRNAIAKIMIRNLIKESASKENFLGAPWIIREELADQFGISTTPPENLWDPSTGTFKRRKKGGKAEDSMHATDGESNNAHSSTKLPKPRYPIEDSEVPLYANRSHPEMETLAVPLPKSEYLLPQESVSTIISVWTALFVYARPLKLFPFNFDDFESALRKQDLPFSKIIPELHMAVIKIAGDHTHGFINKLVKQGVKPRKLMARSAKYRTEDVEDNGSNTQSSSQENIGQDEPTNPNEEEEVDVHATDLPPEDGQIINYMDYTYVGAWWRWKVDYDSWPRSVLACLLHLATVRDLPILPEVLEHLTGEVPILDTITGRIFTESKTPWKAEDILEKYASLSVIHKLDILSFIIRECVITSTKIRQFMDDCLTELTELKKEKRELEAKRKEMLEEQKEFQKLESPEKIDDEEKTALAEEEDEELQQKPEDEEYSESEIEEEEDVEIKELKQKLEELETSEPIAVNRQEKIRIQNQLKELEDEVQQRKLARARALARERNAASRERNEAKRRLDNDMAKLLKRDFILDRELRKCSGSIRMKPLGWDRFWNKYWWLDGYGSGSITVLDQGISGPWSKANTVAYGTGRLWVEGSGMPDFLGKVSGGTGYNMFRRKKKIVATEGGGSKEEFYDSHITLSKDGSAIGQNWMAEGEWRYYDDPEQIDEILCWLNPKGVREQVLKNNLLKYYDSITHNLRKRKEELQTLMQLEELQANRVGQRGRPRTVNSADRYMHYSNRWKD